MTQKEKQPAGCLRLLLRILALLGLMVVVGLGYLKYRIYNLYSPDTYRRAVQKIGATQLQQEAVLMIEDFKKQHPDPNQAPGPDIGGLPKSRLPEGMAALPNVTRANPTRESVILRIPDFDYTVLEILGPDAALPEEHHTDHEEVVKVGERIYYRSSY